MCPFCPSCVSSVITPNPPPPPPPMCSLYQSGSPVSQSRSDQRFALSVWVCVKSPSSRPCSPVFYLRPLHQTPQSLDCDERHPPRWPAMFTPPRTVTNALFTIAFVYKTAHWSKTVTISKIIFLSAWLFKKLTFIESSHVHVIVRLISLTELQLYCTVAGCVIYPIPRWPHGPRERERVTELITILLRQPPAC